MSEVVLSNVNWYALHGFHQKAYSITIQEENHLWWIFYNKIYIIIWYKFKIIHLSNFVKVCICEYVGRIHVHV